MFNKELERYIDKVGAYYRQCTYHNQFEVAGLLREVLDFLKRWQKVDDSDANDGWIPCSDKLPPEKCEVLIYRKQNQISIGYYSKLTDWYDQTVLHCVPDVVAWMPLPDSYKE